MAQLLIVLCIHNSYCHDPEQEFIDRWWYQALRYRRAEHTFVLNAQVPTNVAFHRILRRIIYGRAPRIYARVWTWIQNRARPYVLGTYMQTPISRNATIDSSNASLINVHYVCQEREQTPRWMHPPGRLTCVTLLHYDTQVHRALNTDGREDHRDYSWNQTVDLTSNKRRRKKERKRCPRPEHSLWTGIRHAA